MVEVAVVAVIVVVAAAVVEVIVVGVALLCAYCRPSLLGFHELGTIDGD